MVGWVVDASNVMGARPDGWWRDRTGGLHRLLDEVVRWHDEAGEDVVVVADGHPGDRLAEGRHYGVELRFAHSRARNAADDLIVELVEAAARPDQLRIATSDRALRARVEELGASVEGAGAFLARVADTAARRADRAVLAQFSIDEDALLGRGGEARVFAIDDARVLRLPHPGVPPEALEERRRLLDRLALPEVVATPVVLEHRRVGERLVVVEARLPGANAMEVLARRSTDRQALVRDHLEVASRIASLPCPVAQYGEVCAP